MKTVNNFVVNVVKGLRSRDHYRKLSGHLLCLLDASRHLAAEVVRLVLVRVCVWSRSDSLFTRRWHIVKAFSTATSVIAVVRFEPNRLETVRLKIESSILVNDRGRLCVTENAA